MKNENEKITFDIAILTEPIYYLSPSSKMTNESIQNIKITLQYYTHVSPEWELESAAKLNEGNYGKICDYNSDYNFDYNSDYNSDYNFDYIFDYNSDYIFDYNSDYN